LRRTLDARVLLALSLRLAMLQVWKVVDGGGLIDGVAVMVVLGMPGGSHGYHQPGPNLRLWTARTFAGQRTSRL